MNLVKEEKALLSIFKIVREAHHIEVPPLHEVEFYTDRGGSLGRVGKHLGSGSMTFGICTNYSAGEMDITNPRFVKTVCHELVHYNGIMNHKDEFWQALSLLYERVMNELGKEET